MKATRDKSGKKSRGKRKARPVKGRAKRAAKRPRAKTKTTKSRKATSPAPAARSRRKSIKTDPASTSGRGRKSRAAKARPLRAGSRLVLPAPAKRPARGALRGASRFRVAAQPRSPKVRLAARRRSARRDPRHGTVVKSRRGVAGAGTRADDRRALRNGYDGIFATHNDLIPVAKEIFDRLMPPPNQTDLGHLQVRRLLGDRWKIRPASKTEEGFRQNLRIGVRFIEAWLRGRGTLPNAATAEISRAQVWQQIKAGAKLKNGLSVTRSFFEAALDEEMRRAEKEIGAEAYAEARFADAVALFRLLALSDEFIAFPSDSGRPPIA